MEIFKHDVFHEMPVMGILRNIPYDDVFNILPVYIRSGLGTLEITMDSHHALDIIRDAVKTYGDSINIGAGTVTTISELKNALDAGAQFIVSPNTDEEVIKACSAGGIPVFPGAITPTEIMKAWKLGAFMVKVFPAGLINMEYFKCIRQPLKNIPMMATGGVGLSDITCFKSLGINAFGMGSLLFNKDYIKNKDWESLYGHFKEIRDLIRIT